MIHHIDGNGMNNLLSNLYLCKNNCEHARIHNSWEIINSVWWKTCRNCNKKLSLEENFWKRKSGYYLSFCKKCIVNKQKLWRKKQKTLQKK